jgi:NAD(P)-dependent dehydrogenase (short-subunit alcohol dehydrogenase family)
VVAEGRHTVPRQRWPLRQSFRKGVSVVLWADTETSGNMPQILVADIGFDGHAPLEERISVEKSLDGRVALVTGASSGVGKAIALRFLGAGAKVVAVDVDEKGLSWVEAHEGRACGVTADVRDLEALRGAAAAAVDNYGGLDTVAAVAGVVRLAPFLEMTTADRDLVFDVNIVGVWNTLQAAIPAILESPNPKRAIVCGSVASVLARVNNPAYVTAKHGLVGLVKSVALDFATYGLTVNMISPAAIRTPMGYSSDARAAATTPLGRRSTAEEIAAFFEFVAQADSGYMTGENIVVDGGLRILNAHDLPLPSGSVQ